MENKLSNVVELKLPNSDDVVDAIKHAKEALAEAESGEYSRFACVLVRKDGAIMKIHSKGGGNFTLMGALMDLAMSISSTAIDIDVDPLHKD